jgi:hypothetical protein
MVPCRLFVPFPDRLIWAKGSVVPASILETLKGVVGLLGLVLRNRFPFKTVILDIELSFALPYQGTVTCREIEGSDYLTACG